MIVHHRIATTYCSFAVRSAAVTVGILLAACATPMAQPTVQPNRDVVEPHTALGNFLAARQAQRMRDSTNASRYIRDALRTDPNNAEFLTRANNIYIEDGQFDAAVDAARRAAAQGPSQPLGTLTLAVSAIKSGNYNDAAALLTGLPNTGINRVLVPMLRAWATAGQGDATAAIDVMKPLNEVNGFRTLSEFHAALIEDMLNHPAEAEAHYRKSLEGDTPSARVVEAAGAFFERQGQAATARELYSNHLKQFPDSSSVAAALMRAGVGPAPAKLAPDAGRGLAEALFDIAAALRQENNNQVALLYARMALALAPDSLSNIVLVADTLESLNQRAAAVALYEKLPANAPQSYSVQIRVADNLNQMGNSDEAIRRLNALAAADTARPDALIVVGQILRAKENYVDSADAYTRALARIPTIDARHWALYYARGIAYERAKQWPKAEADFLKALDLQPEQPDVMNYLAYSWVEQGLNFDRARTMLERAVQLRPNSGHIVDSLGWVLYRIGQVKESVPVLERAVELMPADPVLLDHLGDALWRVGRTTEARFQWQRSLSNDPEPELKGQLQRKIERGLDPASDAKPI
jgi:tetratricopeptide (TPR) repeat protein